MLTVECPKCQRKLEVPDELASEDLYCYRCNISLNEADPEGLREAQKRRWAPTITRWRGAMVGVLVGMAAASVCTFLGPVGQVAAGVVAGAGIGAAMGAVMGFVGLAMAVFLHHGHPSRLGVAVVGCAVTLALMLAIALGLSLSYNESERNSELLVVFAACGGSVMGGLTGWCLSNRR